MGGRLKRVYYGFINFFVNLALKFPFPKKFRKYITFPIFSYLFIGGLTTLVHQVVYLFLRYIGILFSASLLQEPTFLYTIATFSAILFAFLPNKIAVFETYDFTPRQLFREFWTFLFSRLFAWVAGLLFMWVTVTVLGWNDILMNLMSSVFVVIANYITSKFFVFNRKENRKKETPHV